MKRRIVIALLVALLVMTPLFIKTVVNSHPTRWQSVAVNRGTIAFSCIDNNSKCPSCRFVRIFHDNGNLFEEGTWQEDHWTGRYCLYYENGRLHHEFYFNEAGRREGSQRYFYENGQLALETVFSDGREVGVRMCYDENGGLSSKTIVRTVGESGDVSMAGETFVRNAF